MKTNFTNAAEAKNSNLAENQNEIFTIATKLIKAFLNSGIEPLMDRYMSFPVGKHRVRWGYMFGDYETIVMFIDNKCYNIKKTYLNLRRI